VRQTLCKPTDFRSKFPESFCPIFFRATPWFIKAYGIAIGKLQEFQHAEGVRYGKYWGVITGLEKVSCL
jgi:hypothetical protein